MTPDRTTFAKRPRRSASRPGSPWSGISWKEIFTLRVVIGILAVAGMLVLITLLLMFLRKPQASDPGQASAAMTSIAPPTSTPRILLATPTQPADVQPTATLLPGQIGLGLFVQITGTQGSGLRVRSEPGLEAASLFLGFDSEVFQVVDGPREVDGHTWWKLTAPYDSTRTGWAAQDYLVAIETP